jgi:hypothetical protein
MSLLKEAKKELARIQKVIKLLSPKGKGKGKEGQEKTTRNLTPEARKAIGDAQRARWAAKKKAKAS